MWAKLEKQVDLADPISFTDQVYLGCFQRAAQVSSRLVMDTEIVLELISTSTDVKTEEENPKGITAWSCDTEGHAQKCFERKCDLAHKSTDQLSQFSPTLVWMITK